MQNVVEDVYTQVTKDNQEAALNTMIAQHMTVIEQFRNAEDQGCLDMDQVHLIRSELGKINASLHTLAEGRNGHTADETRAAL